MPQECDMNVLCSTTRFTVLPRVSIHRRLTAANYKIVPLGALDDPFNPVALALGASAAFVARGHDKDRPQLQQLLSRPINAKFSFVEIYTQYRIFNDCIRLMQCRFATTIRSSWTATAGVRKTKNKGIILDGYTPQVVNLDQE
jgi:hypothetical protein